MKYFTIDRIKEAIDHLAEFHSKWIVVPLVFAANGIYTGARTNPNLVGKAGTDRFLDQYFDGGLMGLPAPGANNTLRPKFKDVDVAKGDYVSHQKVKLWGSHYSSRGYREMASRGYLSIDDGAYRLNKSFWNEWYKQLPEAYHFEELLVWLYAFSGFNDAITSWAALSNDFQERHVGKGNRFPTEYQKRFRVNNKVPWPADLLNERPSNVDLQKNLMPTRSATPLKTVASSNGDSLAEVAEAFENALASSNISFGDRHGEVVRRFVSSIVSKPFLILTGLSGSGKTQIAIRFGEWLGENRSLVVPVRPDWTSGESLFGYENLLDTSAAREWVVPEVLEFLITAARDEDHPHLLVLDEMNLAHVERYFGDFLSGMESGKPVIPNLEKDAGRWRMTQDAPKRIPIPSNLIVVGTVNVDETTYMFSPKVLDRAHTIEFRVETSELNEDLSKPTPCLPAAENFTTTLLRLLRDDEWQESNPATDAKSLSTAIKSLHLILAKDGFEFGHRVFSEALRFAAFYEAAGEKAADDILDVIVYQKILPRLHGSQKRLGKTLRVLAKFAFDLQPQDGVGHDAALHPAKELVAPAKMPRTFVKLRRMHDNLRTYQFASFAE